MPQRKAISTPLENMVRSIWLLEKTAREAGSQHPVRGIIGRAHFDCVRVDCAPLTEHVPWEETDPATIAHEYRIISPSAGGSAGETRPAAPG